MSDTEQAPEPQDEFGQRRPDDDMEDYTEKRKVEKQKEEDEIAELKRKRADRIKERAEEEKRLAVQRKEEDARRKAEEEERKKKKAEDEEKRKKEKERRRREAEKRKGPKKPNFTIVKREDGEEVMVEEEEDADKPPQKGKEQLEREKQAALAQRITPLADLEGQSTEQLEELARNLHNQLRNLVSHEYDLEEKYKLMQYDIVELQERTRAMSKTKKRGTSSVQIDDSYDRMNDRFQNAPPKILVANKFEGNLDRRTWNEKVDCYNKKEDLVDINKDYNDYLENYYDSLYFAGGL